MNTYSVANFSLHRHEQLLSRQLQPASSWTVTHLPTSACITMNSVATPAWNMLPVQRHARWADWTRQAAALLACLIEVLKPVTDLQLVPSAQG